MCCLTWGTLVSQRDCRPYSIDPLTLFGPFLLENRRRLGLEAYGDVKSLSTNRNCKVLWLFVKTIRILACVPSRPSSTPANYPPNTEQLGLCALWSNTYVNTRHNRHRPLKTWSVNNNKSDNSDKTNNNKTPQPNKHLQLVHIARIVMLIPDGIIEY